MSEIDKQELSKIWSTFKTTLIVVLVLLFIVLLTRNCTQERQIANGKAINMAMGDSLQTWRDKEGNYRAKIGLIQSEKAEYFLQMQSADTTIKKLQKLVKEQESKIKHGGSIAVINTDASIHAISPSHVSGATVVHDTIFANYKSDFNLKGWVYGTVTSSRINTEIDLKFKEEIDVTIGTEKTGFLGLGKGKPFAEVTLHNPYNKVNTLRAYSTKPIPTKQFGVGPVLAYGVGAGFIPQVFIGIGVNWNIIKL